MRTASFAAGLSVLLLPLSLHAQGGPGRGGTQIPQAAQCPPGQTEVRPRNCQAPELQPVPSIVDYRPRSTLVAPVNMRPKAKFPAIDFHGHMGTRISTAEGLTALGATLDSIGVRLMLAADNATGERLRTTMAAVRAHPTMKDRVRVMTGISLNNVDAAAVQRIVSQLEEDIAAGAVGIGEVGKGFGLSTRKADGSRLKIDDPILDPIWQAAARLRIPVFIHTADPQEFFQPTIDFNNERWLELALFPGRRFPPDQYPSFEQLMTERDNLFRKHPRTTFVAAHMGWHANDLGRLGKMMTEMPNLHAELGAVLYDIGRQPRAAREFFIRFQDRILFGKDSFQPEEYPYYWRVFETADDYFDYYRDYHAFWKLYGLDLPDAVLKKIYYQNALRITPGLPQTGWPR